MKRSAVVITLAMISAGCSRKANDITNATNGIAAIANSASAMAASAEESQKFLAARQAKGDTVAMNYKDLEGYLPASVSGYTADGGASGQSMNMGAFSMATAEQKYVAGTDPDVARIHVTIVDYAGSAAGYGMMSPYLAMNISTEDDHHRAGTVAMNVPYTFGMGEYDKDNKDAKIVVGTRYRFLITVEATGQKSDQSKLVTDIATEIAKKFADK